MSYQALYRKYRPADFSAVKGQDHIVRTLKNQISSGRIGHAYLFCGTRGTGKTTVAKIFARAVNCENPGPDGPCGTCAMCRAIAEQTSMNVVEIDAASNNRVDDIRQVIDEVQYSPAEGRFKVYIIDEVHMLSVSAFNALLKTLEEPPSYLIFILATTEAHKIPLTILSRCQRYDFRRIRVDTIQERLRELLEQEGIEAEDRALDYIARQADGALRDGLSLLEQCISFYFGEKLTYENVLKALGAVDHTVYHEMTRAILDNNVELVVELVRRLVEQGRDLTQFVSEFVWYMRNLLVLQTAKGTEQLVDASEESLQEMKQFAGQIEPEMLFRYIRILSDLANQMKFSANKRVILEVALIRLCCPQMERDYDSLVNRLRNLEAANGKLQEKIASGHFAVAAQPDSEDIPDSEPEVSVRPDAVPEEVRMAVENWNQVLRHVGPVSREMLSDVLLSVSEDGALILAFAQETRAEYFKGEENRQELIQALAQLIDRTVQIDVRYVTGSEHSALPELREVLKNVPVEIID